MPTPDGRSRPSLVFPPASLYRVGRARAPLHFSHIDALDADLDVGSRFDVPGVGVMYAATERVGAYKETMAYFRSATSDFDEGGWFMPAGTLAAEWREARRMATFTIEEPLPFVNLEADDTLTWLTGRIATRLASLDIDNLDQAVVRGGDRRVTRAIAALVYAELDDDEETRYSGIRYSSRFQSHECWAIFEGVRIGDVSTTSIDLDDADLLTAARSFGVTVF